LKWNKEQFSWLEAKAENYYTQFGEWGILNAIFDRIGTSNQYCLEVGAADGLFLSNSRGFIEAGWKAILIEKDVDQFQKLNRLYQNWHFKDHVTCLQGVVEATGGLTLDGYLETCDAPNDIDLVVIDIDSADYHIFNSLLKYRPRVVMAEYDPNADPDFIPPINGEGQAGMQAIIKLGVGKLYYPIVATWCNVIFVQQDLVHLLVDAAPNIPDYPKGKLNVDPEFALPAAPKVAAVTSIPQLGHNVNFGCQLEALSPFGIGIRQCYGAFWHQALTEGINEVLKQGADYVLTMDYDVLFTSKHIADLMSLALANPDVDVIIPCLAKREGNGLCAHTKEQDATRGGVNLNDELIPIQLGHFGLTLFKASAFDRLQKPWFQATPDEHGGWGEGHVDADMNFWLNCEASGLKVMLARHVRVGHIEYMATIPNAEDPRKTDYVHVGEWRKWAVKENEAVNERLRIAKESYARTEN